MEPAHEEQLRQDFAVLRRAAAELAQRKREAQTAALHDLAHVGEKSSFEVVSRSLEDPSAAVRQAAVRALYQINPEVAASFFNSALREGSAERRRVIGAALAGSDLATEAIYNLNSEDSRTTYRAFSLLFLLAKAGEAQPLMRVIEHHPNITLRLAMIALLASSGETAVLPGFHQLVT
ncbi:MAG: HEAT repeat domain-containing protein, partial [Pyrinomonadaceae bacterium]